MSACGQDGTKPTADGRPDDPNLPRFFADNQFVQAVRLAIIRQIPAAITLADAVSKPKTLSSNPKVRNNPVVFFVKNS